MADLGLEATIDVEGLEGIEEEGNEGIVCRGLMFFSTALSQLSGSVRRVVAGLLEARLKRRGRAVGRCFSVEEGAGENGEGNALPSNAAGDPRLSRVWGRATGIINQEAGLPYPLGNCRSFFVKLGKTGVLLGETCGVSYPGYHPMAIHM
jgi:hypothetical protein